MLRDYAALMTPWASASADNGSHDQERSIRLREAVSAFERLQRELQDQILRSICNCDPAFFENLIIDVMLALGYGKRRRDLARCLGRSGDGGVDGVVSMDELGLDQVYFQAKRLRPGHPVPPAALRDFAGSLDAHRAPKGVFVTTTHFSQAAEEFRKSVSRRVVLVDGKALTDLMIRYNIGVVVQSSFQIKEIDAAYFRPPSRAPARR